MPGQLSICRMAPPLTIGYEELDRGLEVFEEAVTAVAKSKARPGRPPATGAGCGCSDGGCCQEQPADRVP